jgi:hypothetical protein
MLGVQGFQFRILGFSGSNQDCICKADAVGQLGNLGTQLGDAQLGDVGSNAT